MTNVVPSSLILVNLMMEALLSSETSVITRITLSYIPEDGILRSHHYEILRSYLYQMLNYALKQAVKKHDLYRQEASLASFS
jgi:hypothetical protein